MLTRGNQKDPCLSKLYIVEFAIIYIVVYLFNSTENRGSGGGADTKPINQKAAAIAAETAVAVAGGGLCGSDGGDGGSGGSGSGSAMAWVDHL